MEARLVSREEAAKRCGLTASGFGKWVLKGIMPGPIPGTCKYDLKAIDLRLDVLSGINGTSEDDGETELDKWLRDQGLA